MKPSVNRVLCVNASDQINLQDSSSTQVETDLRLLELAFRERLLAIGGNAVILESLVTAAEGNGYQGTAEKAAETLIGSGRFSIAPGPSDRSIVWRSDPGAPRSETGK